MRLKSLVIRDPATPVNVELPEPSTPKKLPVVVGIRWIFNIAELCVDSECRGAEALRY